MIKNQRRGNLQNLGILKTDTIKQVEMKEKLKKKSILGKGENYSKPNYIAEISSKRYSGPFL